MRVMTLGGLSLQGTGLSQQRDAQRGMILLAFAPLLTIGLLGTIMYLHRRSFR